MLINWFENIDFAYPWILTLLILLPVIAIEYFRRQKKSQANILVSTTHFINKVKTLKTRFHNLPFVLRLLALACLIIALARPRYQFTQTESNGKGIDIVLCFDISGSMTLRDFPPTRIDAAKEVATQFVQQRNGDRIGIVIFSNISFTLCPVTTDYAMVLNAIQNIQSGYLQDEGTAIGSGLATSVDRLQYSKAKSKVVILLTDGVDFGGKISPDIATQMAKTFGVKVYTIGIGSINAPTVNGQQSNPADSELVYNPKLLQTIAQQTGGKFFQAKDKEALQEVYASINQLEKSDVKISSFNRYEEKFLPWLIAALILIFVEEVLRLTAFRKFP
ncbi:aerotolerance regulator BatA [Arachidicoccus ginsenosidimutans]|uniref:vWA domain-containing protein n=1 Tax=Arachidicoccus sp. BS20 TaxID=1850526 RepID=UPI0007F12C6C|nr:VWA domain-containing protein [Arachidicoccus sp. BS20]ANI89544.1 aerotolerance regulator BatA [Arachidicoccus sp. BS20]